MRRRLCRLGLAIVAITVAGAALWFSPRMTPRLELPGLTLVDFSPDARIVATPNWTSSDGFIHGPIQFWDVATGREQASYPLDGYDFQEIRFSPDGRLLALFQADKNWRLLDVVTGKELGKLNYQGADVPKLFFSRGGRSLVYLDWDGGPAKLCDGFTLQDRATLNLASCAAFSPDGKIVATDNFSTKDSKKEGVLLWDVASGGLLEELRVQPSQAEEPVPEDGQQQGERPVPDVPADFGANIWLSELAWSPDGRSLAVSTSKPGYGAILWDMTTHKERVRLPGGETIAFSNDSKTLITWEGSFWEVETGNERKTQILNEPKALYKKASVSADGKIMRVHFRNEIAPNRSVRKVRQWLKMPRPKGYSYTTWKFIDTATLQEVAVIEDVPRNLHDRGLSPDGKTIAVGVERYRNLRDDGKKDDSPSSPETEEMESHRSELEGRRQASSRDISLQLWDVPPQIKRRWWLDALAIAVLAFLAGWWFWRRHRTILPRGKVAAP